MPSYYNIEEGIGHDESGQLVELTSNEVHLGVTGGEVLGSSEGDIVFTNYGNAYIDLGAGIDQVRFWGRQSTDFRMSYERGVFTLTHDGDNVEIKNVELIEFDDRKISTVQIHNANDFFATSKTIYSFISDETHESYTYNNFISPSGLVRYGVGTPIQIDAKLDGIADLLVPLDKGYRTGVDTRQNYLVFEDIYGEFEFSSELTSKTPYATSPIVVTFINLINFNQKSIITISHDSARVDEESNEIYWKNGDLTIIGQNPFEEITDTLIPDGMLPISDEANRNNATNAHALAVGDFNGDGLQDVFVPDWSQRFILQQKISGGFEFVSNAFINSIGSEAIVLSLLANDFNSDGFDDLILGYPEGLSSLLILGGENGFSNSSIVFTLPESAYGIDNSLHMQSFSSDYDGDGDDDLIFVHTKAEPDYGGAYIQYLENDGFMNFQDKTDEAFSSQEDFGFMNNNYSDYWASFDYDDDGDEDFFGSFGTSNSDAMYVLVAENKDGVFDLKSYPINYEPKFIFTNPRTKELTALTHHDLISADGENLETILTLETLVSSNMPVDDEIKIWLGSSADDFSLDDMILSLEGSDFIDASSGLDTVIFTSSNASITNTSNGYSVNGDTLINVERIQFTDANIALDLEGSAGLTVKTLAAVIGEAGLSNKEYVGIGLELFDAGQSLADVCELALGAVGATTNEEVVNLLYTNLYGEAPTTEQAQPFVDLLDDGIFTKGSLAAAAAELTDDLGVIDLVGLAETGIEYV